MHTYDHQITVQPADIDVMNHVNNVVYLQWVQDAASAHWITHAPAEVKEKYNWVVLRHEINYRSPALLHDELIAKTWVRSYESLKSVRIVQIIRKRDAKLLAEATSTWCLLSAASSRPVRIGEEITSVFTPSVIKN